MYYDFDYWEDDAIFLLKATIVLCILILLVHLNFYLATNICDNFEIPYDLALTFTSIGMRNNLIVIMTVLEFSIPYILYCKIKKIISNKKRSH